MKNFKNIVETLNFIIEWTVIGSLIFIESYYPNLNNLYYLFGIYFLSQLGTGLWYIAVINPKQSIKRHSLGFEWIKTDRGERLTFNHNSLLREVVVSRLIGALLATYLMGTLYTFQLTNISNWALSSETFQNFQLTSKFAYFAYTLAFSVIIASWKIIVRSNAKLRFPNEKNNIE